MTTALPFRLLIQQRITDALKEITPGNGYANDLSDLDGKPRVVRGKALFGADDPLPLVAILQPPHPTDPVESPIGSTEGNLDWVLLIQGFVEDDADNPTDPAEILLADVKKRLAILRDAGETGPTENILGLGGSASPDTAGTGNAVVDFTIGNGVARPSDALSSKAYFWMMIVLKIVENSAKPYGA